MAGPKELVCLKSGALWELTKFFKLFFFKCGGGEALRTDQVKKGEGSLRKDQVFFLKGL